MDIQQNPRDDQELAETIRQDMQTIVETVENISRRFDQVHRNVEDNTQQIEVLREDVDALRALARRARFYESVTMAIAAMSAITVALVIYAYVHF